MFAKKSFVTASNVRSTRAGRFVMPMNKILFTKQTTSSALTREVIKETMENFAELMQRLLEIQSGGRQRTSKLTTEADRLAGRLENALPRKNPRQRYISVNSSVALLFPFAVSLLLRLRLYPDSFRFVPQRMAFSPRQQILRIASRKLAHVLLSLKFLSSPPEPPIPRNHLIPL